MGLGTPATCQARTSARSPAPEQATVTQKLRTREARNLSGTHSPDPARVAFDLRAERAGLELGTPAPPKSARRTRQADTAPVGRDPDRPPSCVPSAWHTQHALTALFHAWTAGGLVMTSELGAGGNHGRWPGTAAQAWV